MVKVLFGKRTVKCQYCGEDKLFGSSCPHCGKK